MVSLNKNEAMSFSNSALNEDEEVNPVEIDNDEDELLASTTEESNSVFRFKSVNTITAGIIQICACVALFVASTVLPLECRPENCAVKPFSILLWLHCLFWGMFLICDQYIQYEHIKVRRRGYLEFYNATRTLSQLPFWITSTWSTFLLTISTVLNDHCNNDSGTCALLGLKKAEYIAICIGIEVAILLGVLVTYSYRVYKFNASKDTPDVLRDDVNSTSMDFGPKSLGPIDDEIFERQADLIRYYKDHNAMLRRKVLELTYQISNRSTTHLS